MLRCPKWPRGGRGQKTLGQCPKVYSFFFLKASLNFALLSLAVFGHFDTFPGGWMDGWGKNQDYIVDMRSTHLNFPRVGGANQD